MKEVIIMGAGGHAAEIDEYIKYSQKITGKKELNIIGFLDDNPSNYGNYKLSAPLIGRLDNHKIVNHIYYIVGIANPEYRRFLIDKFKASGARFITYIHCTAYASESSVVGEGTIIGPNANVGPNVKIGQFTLINSRCSLGHDTVIGDYNVISPNVCFSGFSRVGDENFFGINCSTIPNISVGNRNKIAAGMVLDHDVENDSVVFYRYKEKVIAVPRKH